MPKQTQSHLAQRLQWPDSAELRSAISVCKTLQEHGYEALLAGGAVRDAFIQRQTHDFDVATSARPDEVESLFDRVEKVGQRFGIMIVVLEAPVEVATFRSDGTYSDGRRPDQIQFTGRKEDAFRRDFTVNALFYDPIGNQLFDDTGLGFSDLSTRTLRAVGDPHSRFVEDHLRILRFYRFAVQLGFSMDPKTHKAAGSLWGLVQQCSRERIINEFRNFTASSVANLAAFSKANRDDLNRLCQLVEPSIDTDQWVSGLEFFSRRTEFDTNAALGDLGLQMVLFCAREPRDWVRHGFKRDEDRLAKVISTLARTLHKLDWSAFEDKSEDSSVSHSSSGTAPRKPCLTDPAHSHTSEDLLDIAPSIDEIACKRALDFWLSPKFSLFQNSETYRHCEALFEILRLDLKAWYRMRPDPSWLTPLEYNPARGQLLDRQILSLVGSKRELPSAPSLWVQTLKKRGVQGQEFGTSISQLWTVWIFQTLNDASS